MNEGEKKSKQWLQQMELLSKVVYGRFQAAASWGLIPSMNGVP